MNKLGSGGATGTGGFLFPDPVSESAAVTAAAHASEHRALVALKEYQDEEYGSNGHATNGHGTNGHGTNGHGSNGSNGNGSSNGHH